MNIYEEWFSKNVERLMDDLFALLKFKSISADINCKDEILKCARWLQTHLEKIGLNSCLLNTPSNPIVFAENKKIDKSKPTVLIYGHYDVQPVDPLEEWIHPPFEPKMVDEQIFGRGAQDDKGQIFYTICAIEFFLQKYKDLPVNIKFCIEGEEEVSSLGLSKSIEKYKDQMSADYLLAVDFNIPHERAPALTLGARGVVTLTLELKGSNIDLHSGELGGIAYNPLRAAVELLAKLWDEEGRIAIDGFYDDVIVPKKEKLFTGMEKNLYSDLFDIRAFHRENNFTLQESNWFRPTIEINGIGGGYFQKGFKTVIPKTVICKLSSRIVPNQNPHKIALLIKEFLQKHVKKGIELKVDIEGEGAPFWSSEKNELCKALTVAIEEAFNIPATFIYAGGSVPIIEKMVSVLKTEPVMIGLGVVSDNAHAPNEHFSKDRFKKGFLSIVKGLDILGGRKKHAGNH